MTSQSEAAPNGVKLSPGSTKVHFHETHLVRLLRQTSTRLLILWMGFLIMSGMLSTRAQGLDFLQSIGGQGGISKTDLRPLEAGKPVEREIVAGETHQYQIALETGQLLQVGLDRQGLNLSMALFGPHGKKLIEVNRNAYPLGQVPILFVTETAGRYRLEVRLRAADKGGGGYKVGIEVLRTATDKDRLRVLAEWTFIEGQQLSEQGSAHRESIVKHEQSLSLYRAVGDRRGEARALNFIGLAYSELAENRKAIEHYTQSLPVYQALGDHAGEATVLNNIGLGHGRLSDRRKALEYFNRAVPLRRLAGDRQGEAITLNNIGMAHAGLSEYRKALDYLSHALPIYQAIGHHRLEAGLLHNIGQIYTHLGEWQKSLECFGRALPVARAVGNQRLEASIVGAIGAVYALLNEHQKALDYYTRSLPLHRASDNRRGEATALARIGRINRHSGDNQKALDRFNQALAVFRGVGDRRGEAMVLRDIGQLHETLADEPRALDSLNQALTVARAIGTRDIEAGVLNDLGVLYTSAREYGKATGYLNQALALYRGIGTPSGEAQTLFNIARAYRRQGNLVAARSRSQEALRTVESLRSNVAGPESRASYFSSVRKLYDLDIDLLMQMSKLDPSRRLESEAIETSERARARSLLESLTEARADIRQGVDEKLLERERSLSELLNAKAERQTQLLSGKHSPEETAAAAREIEQLLADYQQVQVDIRAASPRYAALTQPQPTSLKDIQEQLLDQDTLLLQYALGDERSYVWAVSKDSLISYELPKRADIEVAARRFYELAKSDSKPGEATDAAYQLSQMLLAPLAAGLGSKRLAIVPDGVLHYVPFAALPLPDKEGQGKKAKGRSDGQRTTLPLIARHEIVTLPSASVLAEVRREQADRRAPERAVAVFADPVFTADDPRLKSPSGKIARKDGNGPPSGDLERAMRDVGAGDGFPRLPFSRREAEAIVAVAHGRLAMKALDFQASRATVFDDELSQYRIVHFATHGLLNSTHPELSGIVLSLVDREGRPQNGFLRLHEVYNLKLPAELVVLSACQTALGKEIRGEGLVGLTRGFMYAGAARVVAGLWKVDDAATAELMKRFYKGMFEKGLRPAAALRVAQVEMWKQPRWRQPYYWAGFVLQGEWK